MQVAKKHEWTDLLDLFAKRNAGRPTRLGVFERIGEAYQDYWIEDGMPLTGVAVEPLKGAANIDLMFGNGGEAGKGHMTRSAKSVGRMRIDITADGMDDSLELFEGNGQRTVLRFEKLSFN